MTFGLLLYPGVTALDLVGPYDVLARVPEARVLTVASAPGPVAAQFGLRLMAETDFGGCPPLDVLLVPGGPGQVEACEDAALLRFVRERAETSRVVAAACTGSLILGAAGLLRGYRATTHWRYLDCLAALGAQPVRKRVVSDRNRITSAGVSAAIDLALFLCAMTAGETVAQQIQLELEYEPQPSFHCGSPESAEESLVEAVEQATATLHARRLEQCRRLGDLLLQEAA